MEGDGETGLLNLTVQAAVLRLGPKWIYRVTSQNLPFFSGTLQKVYATVHNKMDNSLITRYQKQTAMFNWSLYYQFNYMSRIETNNVKEINILRLI